MGILIGAWQLNDEKVNGLLFYSIFLVYYPLYTLQSCQNSLVYTVIAGASVQSANLKHGAHFLATKTLQHADFGSLGSEWMNADEVVTPT